MSHLHIHIPHKSPSIQEDLNSFLQIGNLSSESVISILSKIREYLTFFMESFSSIISEASSSLATNNATQPIPLLEQCLDEISFHSSTLLEIYQSSYLEYFDALKCFPLCELAIQEIINYCILKHRQIV